MATEVEFEDRIPEIILEMPHRLQDDQVAIANEIATEARALAPRLNRIIIWPSFVRIPGYLAASIETAVFSRSDASKLSSSSSRSMIVYRRRAPMF